MLTVPYISSQEFTDAYPDIDTSRYNSNTLPTLLRRASSLADQWCKQILHATVDSDTVQMYPTKDMSIRIWPQYRPVVSLASLKYAYDIQSGWNTADLSYGLVLYPTYFDYSGVTFYQFARLTVQYSYVNGFPITSLNGNVLAGASTIAVDDATGIVAGNVLTIPDGVNSEDITVDIINGNTITLSSPLAYAHSDGVSVSGMPNPIRDATGIIAANILSRGVDGAVETHDKDFATQYKSDSVITDDAKTLLYPYQINR